MDLLNRKYPLTRMRRNRMKSFSRNLMSESISTSGVLELITLLTNVLGRG